MIDCNVWLLILRSKIIIKDSQRFIIMQCLTCHTDFCNYFSLCSDHTVLHSKGIYNCIKYKHGPCTQVNVCNKFAHTLSTELRACHSFIWTSCRLQYSYVAALTSCSLKTWVAVTVQLECRYHTKSWFYWSGRCVFIGRNMKSPSPSFPSLIKKHLHDDQY